MIILENGKQNNQTWIRFTGQLNLSGLLVERPCHLIVDHFSLVEHSQLARWNNNIELVNVILGPAPPIVHTTSVHALILVLSVLNDQEHVLRDQIHSEMGSLHKLLRILVHQRGW